MLARRLADAFPAAQSQKRGGIVRTKRRDGGTPARQRLIASSEERLARKLDAHHGTLARDPHGNRHVGVAHVNLRAGATACQQRVNDGVLGPQGHKLRVSQRGIGSVGIHGEGRAHSQLVFPCDAAEPLVERV